MVTGDTESGSKTLAVLRFMSVFSECDRIQTQVIAFGHRQVSRMKYPWIRRKESIMGKSYLI